MFSATPDAVPTELVLVSRKLMNKYLLAFAAVILACCCTAHRLGPMQLANGINFTISAPTATSVAIAGSFNRWDTDRDRLSGPDRRGVWSITLPLPPGRHEYLFFINGKTWMLDPSAPSTNDGMGGENSILIVGESAP
jgi:1,4-alpha-glucan branching enzyme